MANAITCNRKKQKPYFWIMLKIFKQIILKKKIKINNINIFWIKKLYNSFKFLLNYNWVLYFILIKKWKNCNLLKFKLKKL